MTSESFISTTPLEKNDLDTNLDSENSIPEVLRLASVYLDGRVATVALDSNSNSPVLSGRHLAWGDVGSYLLFLSQQDPKDISHSLPPNIPTDIAGGILPHVYTGLDGAPYVQFSRSDIAPLISQPGKIFCVGLNFSEHIKEMGHEIPDYPTFFAKFPSALSAPFSTVDIPESLISHADYEGELAVVIGPHSSIAGFSIMNDFSLRDWQYRTSQWLQGKNLDSSSAFGPWLSIGFNPEENSVLRTWVNEELRQEHSLSDLVFNSRTVIDYLSQFTTLQPGDIISLGTPAGVGHGMTPPRYLKDGDTVRIAIDGLGEIHSTIRQTSNPDHLAHQGQ